MEPINKDGKQFSTIFRAPGVPSVGANRVNLKGSFVVECGSDEKTLEFKNVVWNGKLDMVVGPFELKMGRSAFGDEACAVFVTTQNCRIKQVKFQMADGKQIERSRAVSGSVAKTKAGKRVADYSLNDVRDRCTVFLTFFEKIELVKVPVDVQVGIGF